MKVFLISEGEYSDYNIRAVALDEDDAERKCAILNQGKSSEYCVIEEYDTDDVIVDTSEEVKQKYEMCVRACTGDIKWFIETCLTFESINRIQYKNFYFDGIPEDKCIEVIATFPKNITSDKAKKIMLDRVAKFKAEQQDI